MSAVDLTALLLAGAPVPADLPPAPALPRLQAERIEVPEFLAGTEAPSPADSAAQPVPPPPAPEAQPPETIGEDIVVVSDPPAPPGDPLVEINQQTFEATQAVDEAVVEPIAATYEDVFPKPVRSGLRNFFRNLASPVIFLNYMLQLKPGKAFETLGRFALNTTVGLGGFIDVAKKKPFYLPYRPNGFANTLGYYGIGPGPYFYLPLIGSTTLRDAFGGAIDGLVMPVAVGAPFNDPKFTLPRGALRSLDYRIEFNEEIEALKEDIDPYTTQRERYLAARQAQIDALRGVRVDSGAFVPSSVVPVPQGTVAEAPPVPGDTATPASPRTETIEVPPITPAPADAPAPALQN